MMIPDFTQQMRSSPKRLRRVALPFVRPAGPRYLLRSSDRDLLVELAPKIRAHFTPPGGLTHHLPSILRTKNRIQNP